MEYIRPIKCCALLNVNGKFYIIYMNIYKRIFIYFLNAYLIYEYNGIFDVVFSEVSVII